MQDRITIDIGASSGKVFLGRREGDKLLFKCIHRFPNGYIKKNGHLVWDIEKIFQECVIGIEKAKELSTSIASLSIDTWGCDFVLLDKEGNMIGDAVSYRDKRTENVDSPISFEELYGKTGIQYLSFNTVYQFMALKAEHPEQLENADVMLMIPDYLSYRLTGEIHQEYTNASTTALLDAKKRDWDFDIIDRIGLPHRLFRTLDNPGTCYGYYDGIKVLAAPSHDTASAVFGCPLDSESAFLSSGTWSLLGAVIDNPVLTSEAMKENFTNEGGVDGTIRFLRNLMGTWMLQSVRKELGEISFDELEKSAEETAFSGVVDIEDERFLAPDSMINEVKSYFIERGEKAPESVGEISRCIYESLAAGYDSAIKRLGQLLGKRFSRLAIVGGGSKDGYLCRLTAERTGLVVSAGPVEGSAIGNMLYQIKSEEDNVDIDALIKSSDEIKIYDGRNR